MFFAAADMAQRLEEADMIHLARQVESCTEIFPDRGLCTHSPGNGLAAITLPLFGRKLNHVVGFGTAGPVSGDDIAVFEELYARNNIAGEVDLCPHADVTALEVLATRGYTVNAWINTYVRTLTDEDLEEPTIGHRIDVCRIVSEDRDKFTSISLMGYKDGGRPKLLLETLAHSAVLRPDTRLYLAVADGKVAGSAALALIHTSKGGVAHLYIDSTLPEYRRQGVHAALLRVRLSDARRAGFELASIHARPTTSSARNIERAGFRLAYTKASFSQRSKQNLLRIHEYSASYQS
jgi:GNAT superfamily N-acetyltransferase